MKINDPRLDPKMTYAEFIGPGKKPNGTVGEAFARCKQAGDTVASEHLMKSIVDFNRKLSSFTLGEMRKIRAAVKNPTINVTLNNLFKTALGIPIEKNQQNPDGMATKILEVKAAKIDTLGDMIDPEGIDPRFFQVMVDAYRAVRHCPEDEYRVIPAVKRLIRKEPERLEFMAAIDKMFEMNGLAWSIRYSAMNQSFFIARLQNLAKLKNKKETPNEKTHPQLLGRNGSSGKIGTGKAKNIRH